MLVSFTTVPPQSGFDQNTAVFDLNRVDSNAHLRIVATDSALDIELPPMPGAAKDTLPLQLIRPGRTGDPLGNETLAERAALMRAAVTHSDEAVSHRVDEHADPTPADRSDDPPFALELAERPDVVPLAHAALTQP
jgi:hypothetical protein